MSDGFDSVVFDYDCAVEKDAALRIHGDNCGIVEYKHRAGGAVALCIDPVHFAPPATVRLLFFGCKW